MSTVRVAVIGLGLIGRQRAAALDRIEGATLAATIDPAVGVDPALGELVGATTGRAPGTGGHSGAGVGTHVNASHETRPAPHYATLTELPTELYDAAVIAVPHDQALPIAQLVLESGRPVLIEKPLGVRGSEARELESLASRLSTPSFVGYNYRYLRAIAELLRRAGTGELGELRNLDLLVGHGGHPASAVGWKLDPARAGGGVLLDPGVHLLDLLLRIAPAATCASIDATRGFWPTGIEEDVIATFRAERLLATVRISHIRWVNTFRVEAFGEDGYAIAEGRGGNYGAMTLRLGRRWAWTEAGIASQRASEEVREFGVENDSLHDELADVVARWRGEAPSAHGPQPATMSEARRITELCEALYGRIA